MTMETVSEVSDKELLLHRVGIMGEAINDALTLLRRCGTELRTEWAVPRAIEALSGVENTAARVYQTITHMPLHVLATGEQPEGKGTPHDLPTENGID